MGCGGMMALLVAWARDQLQSLPALPASTFDCGGNIGSVEKTKGLEGITNLIQPSWSHLMGYGGMMALVMACENCDAFNSHDLEVFISSNTYMQ